MKKVLILAVAVFGAVLAQAANCSWSVTFATDDAQSWKTNGAMVMMFAGADMADVKELIATNTGSTLQSALKDKTLKASGSASVKTFTVTGGGTGVRTTVLISVLPSDGQAFWMIFTDKAFTEETQVYWTDVMSPSASKKPTEADFTNTATIAQIAEEYTSAPEPGILVLLALGVAGLALRRKVA